jgi:hypothetical protein
MKQFSGIQGKTLAEHQVIVERKRKAHNMEY